MQRDLQAAIAKANNALIPSDDGDRANAHELQRAAAELKATTASVMTAGLSKSEPVVAEANELHATLCDISAKVRLLHALCLVAIMHGQTPLYVYTSPTNLPAITLSIVTLTC